MKKRDFLSLLYQLSYPLGLMVLGLILLISPDTASALIARVLGWLLTLAGIGIGISAIFDRRGDLGKGFSAVGFVCVGGWLLANPLVLAASLGRFLGILLLLRGLRDLYLRHAEGRSNRLAVITTVAGLILMVLPMTTSRLIFRLCGAAILAIGTAMLLDRLKDQRYLEGGDSNIIDAL